MHDGECYDYEGGYEDEYLDRYLEERAEQHDFPEPEECYDDEMDGDAQSALASVGWGTDEDYGDFGGHDEF